MKATHKIHNSILTSSNESNFEDSAEGSISKFIIYTILAAAVLLMTAPLFLFW